MAVWTIIMVAMRRKQRIVIFIVLSGYVDWIKPTDKMCREICLFIVAIGDKSGQRMSGFPRTTAKVQFSKTLYRLI
jgi:hypothetical protein